ncbi:zinc finger CCHC domain-containing protein 14 [Brachionichthys hirsutus]|uniref:zinc finger CCHC domain-containing protein 14 n=1 Tax=Brachionichthys hirsutus TaxID=412623 RepID=UPI00360432FF
MVESRSCVHRAGVYRWFSCLPSAQRVDFLCGLLDLCVPIELRFLGSCLEELARKDYHSLRDAEIRANNPADLSGLANVTDGVVRSKLLVSLALLGPDSREAAGVLYRTLTHIDTVINNYGLAPDDGRTEEQFLLLFTMASHHPAFSFHQKQVLRRQLGQIQNILQASGGGGEDRAAVCYAQPHRHCRHQPGSLSPATCPPPDALMSAGQPCHTHCTCWRKNQTSAGSGPGSGPTAGRRDQAVSRDSCPPRSNLPPPPPPLLSRPAEQSQAGEAPTGNPQGKAGKAVIERVALRGVTHKSEDSSEYVFEAGWSDGFTSSVVRTQQEVMELLSQLSQAYPDEGVEKFLPQSIELDPRCLTALPCHVLRHHSVQLFFASPRPFSPTCPASPPTAPVTPNCPFTSSSRLGCTVQYRGSSRVVYRVASVQPVISTHGSVMTRPPPLPPSVPPAQNSAQHSPQPSSLPPSVPAPPTFRSLADGGDPASRLSQHHLHPQSDGQPSTQPQSLQLTHSQPASHSHSQSLSHPQPRSQSQPQPDAPEQKCILDWLRRLRLHKYYPVFKQLTMEEFLALTEEDLNKYDLTQGAKKKLKTQLELQNRELKTETRPFSGIARVTPSSHMGPLLHPSSPAGELRVEVDGVPQHHPVPTDSSSSSGCSSSPRSPRAALCCAAATLDRSRDIHRRPEKDRSCLFVLNSSCPTASSRPTAQVLPVQTDPAPPAPSSCSFGPPQSPYHPQATYTQNLLSNPARILTSPRKPRPPPLCTEGRTKLLDPGLPAGFGVGMRVRMENLFAGLNVDGACTLQDSLVCRGLMVETSSATTSTSNSLHHVSHPPLHFHLSSSSPPSPSGYYSCPPNSSSSSSFSSFSSSCPSTKSGSRSGGSGSGGGFVPMATASSVPVAAVSGTSYRSPQPTSSPSPSPSSTSSLDQGSGFSASVCVCCSCGCRGNCGAYGPLPGYATTGYLQSLSAGPSLFTLGPLLHLSPLVASSGGAMPFSYPMMVPPSLYRHSLVSHDQQQGFGFYQPHGIVGTIGQKRAAGNLSCYNCGANGHRAEECKQPAMDSGLQGSFRLKYTPRPDSRDSGD